MPEYVTQPCPDHLHQMKGLSFPADVKFRHVLELVTAQLEVFRQCAVYLSQNGLRVYVREGTERNPVCFVDKGRRGE